MFELKKIVSALLMPLPFCLFLGLIGLGLLWFTRKKMLASVCLTLSLFGIFFAAFQPLSSTLLYPLEHTYPAFHNEKQPIKFVMVLGSGHVVDPSLPITSELSTTGLMRLSEGIRIQRLYPDAFLILSGYDGGTTISQARMMANVAIALGVKKSSIILLETPKDTQQEAEQAARIVKNSPFVIVTSAYHMARAMNEFHAQGLKPIPAPTNFLTIKEIHQPWQRYPPKAQYLEQTEHYWHEMMGTWWQSIKQTMSKLTE